VIPPPLATDRHLGRWQPSCARATCRQSPRQRTRRGSRLSSRPEAQPARGRTIPANMGGIVKTLLLALTLAACSATPAGASVQLLTGVRPDACYAGGEVGETGPLVVDPQYGASFNGHPVMWPVGFSARYSGSEVEVLNGSGNVVATTGRTYHISIAPVMSGQESGDHLVGSMNAYPAAVNCSEPYDFIDCSTAPTTPYSSAWGDRSLASWCQSPAP
jgi:hypothetical protein